MLQRLQKIGGVPRDIFKDYTIVERDLGNALANMNALQVTKATYAADTFSAASHQLIIINVPEWHTGQRPTCLQRATGTYHVCAPWQPAPLPHAGDFVTIKVQPRTLYVATKIWDGAKDDVRQELCMKLIAGLVSQWSAKPAAAERKSMRFTA